MPKISVIVPVYNVEKYLRKCAESLVNQTLSDIEIIFVNDGSTDGSEEIIEYYVNNYREKVKSLKKTNGGLSSARNYGMQYATGEYIAFTDSDDYVELDMYEALYNKAKQEDYDIVECDFIWEYPKKRKIDVGVTYSSKKEALEKARVLVCNKIFKTSIIKASNILFPEGLRYEDVEFFYKIIPNLNKMGFVKKPFMHYVQRENSISNTQNERTQEIFVVLDNVINYYKTNNLYEEYKEELEYTYSRLLLCSSLKRMTKIENKEIRSKLLTDTWEKLNSMFPEWKQNKILHKFNMKNIYMRTVNKTTFKLYCNLLK